MSGFSNRHDYKSPSRTPVTLELPVVVLLHVFSSMPHCILPSSLTRTPFCRPRSAAFVVTLSFSLPLSRRGLYLSVLTLTVPPRAAHRHHVCFSLVRALDPQPLSRGSDSSSRRLCSQANRDISHLCSPFVALLRCFIPIWSATSSHNLIPRKTIAQTPCLPIL